MGKQARIPGKVRKESARKFEVEPVKSGEVQITIDLLEDGQYEVSKLSDEGLPTHYPDENGDRITWYNNFSITRGGNFIKQRYRVTIPGLSRRPKNSTVVIYDDTRGLYAYDPSRIDGDTIELNDGDPAVGHAP